MRFLSEFGGVVLDVSRIDRREIDAFVAQHQPPEPPTKSAETFGGITEQIEDTDDPAYKGALTMYYIQMAEEQFDLIIGAIEITEPANWEVSLVMQELIEAGIISQMTKADFVKFALTDNDRDRLVSMVLYLSTTTEEAIYEAGVLFNATWHDMPIKAWRVKSSPAQWSRAMEDREAARFGDISWREFCELPGPEQSAIVAQFRIITRISQLEHERHK